MAQEFPDITEAFGAFVLSIHEGRYYDAHEDLELLWHPRRFEDNDEVRFWKGCINAAVSFELIVRGRPEPSARVWLTYRKYAALLDEVVTPHKELYVTITQILDQHRSQLCPNF